MVNRHRMLKGVATNAVTTASPGANAALMAAGVVASGIALPLATEGAAAERAAGVHTSTVADVATPSCSCYKTHKHVNWL